MSEVDVLTFSCVFFGLCGNYWAI